MSKQGTKYKSKAPRLNISFEAKLKLLSLFFLFSSFAIKEKIKAQDLHYSQFFNAPLSLNPALTAYTQANARFILNNRSQWASITVPYQSFSASYDMKLATRKRKGALIGMGVSVDRDEAGDSKFGTTKAALSLSWIKSLNRSNRNLISFGAQGAFYQRSIDYSQLYFPEQWNGGSSNLIPSHSEDFSVNQFNFFDISAGTHWFFAPSRTLNFNTGFSAWHLNRPQQSLMGGDEAQLSVKYHFYSEAEIKLDRPYHLVPAVYYAKQGPHSELILGARFHYLLEDDPRYLLALSTGAYIRNKDAFIVYLGMDYKRFKIGASYDINVSELSVASNYMGGMEVSLQWLIFKNKRTRKLEATPCPIF